MWMLSLVGVALFLGLRGDGIDSHRNRDRRIVLVTATLVVGYLALSRHLL